MMMIMMHSAVELELLELDPGELLSAKETTVGSHKKKRRGEKRKVTRVVQVFEGSLNSSGSVFS
jgi:hypothetical protein